MHFNPSQRSPDRRPAIAAGSSAIWSALLSSVLASCSLPGEGLGPTPAGSGDLGPVDAGGGPSGPPHPPGVDAGPEPAIPIRVRVVGPPQGAEVGEPSVPLPDAWVRADATGAWSRTDREGRVVLPRRPGGAPVDLSIFAAGYAPYAAFGVEGPEWTARLRPKLVLTRPVEPPWVPARGDASDPLAALADPGSFREVVLLRFDPLSGDPWPIRRGSRRDGLEGLPLADRLRFTDTAFDAPAFGVSDPILEVERLADDPLPLVLQGNTRSNDTAVTDPDPDAVSLVRVRPGTGNDPDELVLARWTRLDRAVQVDLRPWARGLPAGSWTVAKLWAPEESVLVPIGGIAPETAEQLLPARVDLRFPPAAGSFGSAVRVDVIMDPGSAAQVARGMRLPVPRSGDRLRAFEPGLSSDPPDLKLDGRRLVGTLDPQAQWHRLELFGSSLEGDRGGDWTVVVAAAGVEDGYDLPTPPPDLDSDPGPVPPADSVQLASTRWPNGRPASLQGDDPTPVDQPVEHARFFILLEAP